MQYHRKEWPLWLTEINASTHFQTYYVIGSIGHLGPKSVVWIHLLEFFIFVNCVKKRKIENERSGMVHFKDL